MILGINGILAGKGVASFVGLLDTYTGAIAGYSLRKLKSTYSGYAIRVRRSSDNTSQDIGFKSDGTLDTTSLLSFVGSGNGFVSIWYDQSGNGSNLNQSTAAEQMRIVYGGNLDLLNGKPALTSNYNYAQVGYMSTSAFSSTYNQTTMFNIGSHTNSTAKWLWSATSPFTNPNRVECYQESSSLLSLYAGANMNTTYTPSITTQRIIYAKYNGASSLIAINNGSGTSGNSGGGYMGGLILNAIGLGTANSAASYHQEMIIFNGNQDSNRSGINTNINSYYTIY